MFCTNCGAKVDENVKFCPVCGANMAAASTYVNNQQPAPDPHQAHNNIQVIDKSTYESVNTNQNQITEKPTEENTAKAGFKNKLKGFGKKEKAPAVKDPLAKPQQEIKPKEAKGGLFKNIGKKPKAGENVSNEANQAMGGQAGPGQSGPADPYANQQPQAGQDGQPGAYQNPNGPYPGGYQANPKQGQGPYGNQEAYSNQPAYENQGGYDNQPAYGNQVHEPEARPSSYYGYQPVDDRKSKDLRTSQTLGTVPAEGYPQGYVQEKVKRAQNHGGFENTTDYGDSNAYGTDLSTEARVAGAMAGAYGYQEPSATELANDIRYDDIPNEYMEARIARQLSANRPHADQAPPTGNVAGYIRNNQDNFANRPVDNNPPVSYAQQVQNNTLGYGGANQAYQPNQQYPPENRAYEPAEPTPPAAPPAGDKPADGEKEKFKFKPIYLLPLVIILLVLAGTIFALNKFRKPEMVEVDLSEYIEVTFSGDDGAAVPSASIDSSKFLADHGADVAYTNKDRKDDTYSSPANQFVTELENETVFNFSKEGNLSNGEEITVVANINDAGLEDDYNVHFTNTIKPVIVDGLITQEVQDPFDYINVEFSGESPNISLTATMAEDAPEYMSLVEIAPSKTTELAAGEEVNVSLIFNEDDIFNSYGLRLSPTDKMFTVPGEEEPAEEDEEETEEEAEAPADGFISSVDNLDEDLLGTLKYNAGELIRNTFSTRDYSQISNIEYLGAITGSDASNPDLNNRVMLVYEITADENYEGRYTDKFTYYTFVEYQNVKSTKAEDGEFYTNGPITTDNQIFHKFFVEDDYTYYEIPYYGFGFLEEVISRINNALSGLNIDDSIAVDVSEYFASGDGIEGEYQGNNTRLTLKSDGTLRYKLDQRVHTGSWQEEGGNVTMTIRGVNVDTPINATFENGSINVPEQGEMTGQTFNKMQAMN